MCPKTPYERCADELEAAIAARTAAPTTRPFIIGDEDRAKLEAVTRKYAYMTDERFGKVVDVVEGIVEAALAGGLEVAGAPTTAAEDAGALLPCPFCGHRPLSPTQNADLWWISCTHCEANMSDGTREGVVKSWNARKLRAALAGGLEVAGPRPLLDAEGGPLWVADGLTKRIEECAAAGREDTGYFPVQGRFQAAAHDLARFMRNNSRAIDAALRATPRAAEEQAQPATSKASDKGDLPATLRALAVSSRKYAVEKCIVEHDHEAAHLEDGEVIVQLADAIDMAAAALSGTAAPTREEGPTTSVEVGARASQTSGDAGARDPWTMGSRDAMRLCDNVHGGEDVSATMTCSAVNHAESAVALGIVPDPRDHGPKKCRPAPDHCNRCGDRDHTTDEHGR